MRICMIKGLEAIEGEEGWVERSGIQGLEGPWGWTSKMHRMEVRSGRAIKSRRGRISSGDIQRSQGQGY